MEGGRGISQRKSCFEAERRNSRLVFCSFDVKVSVGCWTLGGVNSERKTEKKGGEKQANVGCTNFKKFHEGDRCSARTLSRLGDSRPFCSGMADRVQEAQNV